MTEHNCSRHKLIDTHPKSVMQASRNALPLVGRRFLSGILCELSTDRSFERACVGANLTRSEFGVPLLQSSPSEGGPSMPDYHSIIAWAVSHLPSTADEARHAIYGQARTALHKRLGNDPQISDAELVNEHHKLEVAIYEVEQDLLLKDMRRFVREETALSPPSLISKIKEFVRSAGDRLGVF